jgi:large subunit ribosomal protein LP0
MLVLADNVGSKQLQTVRQSLRGKAVVLMGKKTLMRKGLESLAKKNQKLKVIIEHIKGNLGLVFTSDDLSTVRNIILDNQVAAPARQGSIAPIEVIVPALNTGLEPTKTSFFQALNIPTKITRGAVEIISPYSLIKVGDKVSESAASLLQMLNIKPFFYGLRIVNVYDNGVMFDPKVLDTKDEDLQKFVDQGILNVTALSLGTGIPNEASIPHLLAGTFKNMLAIAVETDYSFKQAEATKAFLKDPSKFITAPKEEKKEEKKKEDKKPKEEKKPEKKPEKKKEPEPEPDDGGGMGGLFGSDD